MDETERDWAALTTAVAMAAAQARGDRDGVRDLWNGTCDEGLAMVAATVQALASLPTLVLLGVPSDPAAYYRVMLDGLAERR